VALNAGIFQSPIAVSARSSQGQRRDDPASLVVHHDFQQPPAEHLRGLFTRTRRGHDAGSTRRGFAGLDQRPFLRAASAAQSPAACLSAVLCYLMVWPSVTPFQVARDNSLKLFLIRTTRFGVEHVLLTVGGRRVNHYGSGLCIQAPHLLVNRVDAEVWPQICPSFGRKACGSRFISLLKGDHPLSPIS
jgi:hypothetical protein